MRTLITTQLLSLLLLLLQPPQFQRAFKYYDLSDTEAEEFEDYLEELFATGPTKPPTKEDFQKTVIIQPGRPLSDPEYCNDEMKMKNVHNRLYCRKEHFFLQVAYEKVQKICHNIYVPCKNGVKKCHRSKKLIEGVYCNLTAGVKMSYCEYESFYRQGYALITCRWQNDIQEIIPDHVNDLQVISD
ncbi:inactive ribonuclease-like protein 9 [Diceros bicornis minor]|uniref:inactive ribonuclease-like protein 9 n=1 Tax=Diceros bicornis minor TaxID=77932 RepID=UPI0026EEDADA|nr:inactive ribonuclease-like protein 9 [Diceros bicornis minor]